MKYPKLTILLLAVLVFAILLLGQAAPGLAQTDLPTNITADMIADLRAEWQLGRPASLSRPASNASGQLLPQGAVINTYGWSEVVMQSWVNDANGYDIVLLNGDGSNPRLLAPDAANDTRPALSYSGTEVVFVSNRDGDNEIYRVNTDGTGLTQLTFNTFADTRPTFSPDGLRILFSSNRTGHYEIYTMQRDGSQLVRLTTTSGFENIDPAFSPDGKHVAFFQVLTNSARGYLTIVDSDGKNLARLNSTAFWYPGDVFWSPDGTNLTFDGAYDPYFFNDIFILYFSDPENARVLTVSRETTYEDHFTGGWSPESKSLLINRVKYTVVDNHLYITDGGIEARCLALTCGTSASDWQLSVTGLDFLPDWKSVDHTPPVVQFSPLPVYSRSNDLYVSWSARDVGPAGLEWVSLGWRPNLGEWITVSPAIQDNGLHVSFVEPATRYDFRISAADWAENKTPLPQNPDYDITTTTFAWLVGGQAFDPRGHPLPGLTADIDPLPLNPAPTTASDGTFTAWMGNNGDVTLAVNAPFYGDLPSTTRALGPDWNQPLYFPPSANLVQNGTFEENGLEEWTVSGSLPANVTNLERFTGENGVSLGLSCGTECLTNRQPGPPVNYQNVNFDMLVDPDGTVHVLVGITYPDTFDQVVMYDRQPDGEWKYIKLYESSTRTYAHLVRLSRDKQGTLYAFSYLGDNLLLIFKRDSLGSWNKIGERAGRYLDYALGPDGRLYLITSNLSVSDGQINYLEMHPDGTWSEPLPIPAWTYRGARIAVDEDGTVHLIWIKKDDSLYYMNRSPDGSLSEVNYLSQEFNGVFHNFLTVSQGQVHAIFHDHYNIVYMVRSKDGAWSNKTVIPNAFDVLSAVVGPDDVIHFWTSNQGYPDDPIQYWRIAPGQQVSPPVNQSPPPRSMAIDSNGNFHYLFRIFGSSVIEYAGPRLASVAEQVELSQKVTIPARMNAPTLAFLSQVRGNLALSNTHFTVEVDDGITRTEVYNTSENYLWKNNWVDMSAWAGKEVTICFVVYQSAGEPLIQVDLDDISLGAWLTPAIHMVAPTKLYPGDLLKINVYGENFMDKPQVWVDGIILDGADVIYVSSSELVLNLPETMTLGSHNLRVANPDGPWDAVDHAFVYGWQTYLAMINR